MKLLSLTAHTSELCALDQCLNNLLVGGIDRIVLHVNRHGDFNVPRFERLRDRIAPLRGRVFVNPLSLPIATMQHHPALSQGVHLGHLQNWHFARHLGPIDWFMLDASNSLLVREGLGASLEGRMVLGCADMGAWHWRPAYEQDTALLRRHHKIAQHEGTCFRADVFGAMAEVMLQYETRAARRGFDYLVQYPREEALFTHAALEAGIPFEGRRPYIDARWDRGLTWNLADVQARVAAPAAAPDRYGIKRVPRTLDDPIRRWVSEHFGYRRLLQAALDASDSTR